MWLSLWITFVRACMLRNGSRVELFCELASQPRNATLGFLGELLLLHAIVNRLHRFAHAELEILQQCRQLLLQFAYLGLPLLQAFRLKALPLPFYLALALPQRSTLTIYRRKIGMEAIEEARNVLCLMRELPSRCGYDRWIESNTLRNVDTRRGAGYTESQRVGRSERFLVETHRRVQHAGMLRRIDLRATCGAWR